MKLNKYQEKYKEYLAYERRWEEIRKELKNRPLIPLEKPYQHGWEIYLDLRDDIKNRLDFPSIKTALTLVHREGYTRNVRHIKRIRANRSFSSYSTYSNSPKGWNWGVLPYLHVLRQYQYDKLPENVRKWFILDEYNERWVSFRGHQYILNIPSFWILVKTRPHMVTHHRSRGGKLEEEYEYVRKKLHDMWLIYSHNYSSSYPAYKDRSRLRAKISKFKKGEIEDITNDKIPKEYHW